MSKKIKNAQKQKNLIAKRARRAANRARYDKLRDQGLNHKSKRSVAQGKKKKRAKSISHKDGACGNIACKRCDPCKIH